MIERYSRPEMAEEWTLQKKYERWLMVELCASDAWAELGHIPKDVPARMRKNARFTVERIDELERSTHHDVVAFTRCVAEGLGEDSRFLHYGLTSTDVVDTALCMTMVSASKIIDDDLSRLLEILRQQALKTKEYICMGRTHGVHAEPTVFGLKFALWYADIKRCRERFAHATRGVAVGKLSGAVGNYGNLDPFIEQYVCDKLGLEPAPISTQVLQRDRHAEWVCSIALIGATLEKMATEVRSLQRTELREVEEPFSAGQKGSSTMPHKRNPVKSEQICGLSRLLRGYSVTAMEDIALWHERDISHSSAERVILADSSTLIDYMLDQMCFIMGGLLIYPQAMIKDMKASHNLVYSQRLLLALIDAGLLRETAYDAVQQDAMQSWADGEDYLDIVKADERISSVLDEKSIEACFDPRASLAHVDEIYRRLGLE